MQTNTLFQRYLSTVNEALEKNGDELPYKQMIELSDIVFGDTPVQVDVYKDKPENHDDTFVVTFSGGQFDLVGHGEEETPWTWKLPRKHMTEVVEHPNVYVKNPAKLDLSWFEHRLGIA